ncbi:divalent-cation tolerance protein CutA [Candidatus Saccharibacteria bacterium]|nr:divalent-cation tolerance protein CutA [Candidatus Saccharibacteria bacterium]
MTDKNQFCYLYLTCEDRPEADKITQTLLEKHLIACAKFLPVDCKFWWKEAITCGKEILVIMESRLDLFNEIEKVITPLHSYETFVLEAIPVSRVSKKATEWMNEQLRS